MKVYYNPKLKEYARQLRNNSTLSEILLWKFLKGKQMMGYDFHRQKPVDNYILDFYCSKLLLAIEIDGLSHENKYEKDVTRDAHLLTKYGIYTLRFKDIDVKMDINNVLRTIEIWITENTPCLIQG